MENENLKYAIKKIAWGYLLLHLNINLGTINILPDWLGYVFMLGALPVLAKVAPSAQLLSPLAKALVGYSGILWVLTIFGVSFDVVIVNIFVFVVVLYFHFQLLTNIAEIADVFKYPDTKKIFNLRTVRTLLLTVLALPFSWESNFSISIVFVILNVVVALWICAELFELSYGLNVCEDEENLEI